MRSNTRTKPNSEMFTRRPWSRRIRVRVIEEKLIPYKCAVCGINEWKGEPLSLHIDHIDGDKENNYLENLRFLCPN